MADARFKKKEKQFPKTIFSIELKIEQNVKFKIACLEWKIVGQKKKKKKEK